MERNILINDIANFCFTYNMFGKSITVNQIRNGIANNIDDSNFIEGLINTINGKAKRRKHIDIGRLKELLSELEKIRLEIEYKDNERV